MNIRDVIGKTMSDSLCIRLRSLPNRPDGTIIDSPEAQKLFAELKREQDERKAEAEREAKRVAEREAKEKK